MVDFTLIKHKMDKYFMGVDLCDNSQIGMCYDYSSVVVMKKENNIVEVVDSRQKQIKNHSDRIDFDKQVDEMCKKYDCIK